MDSKNEQKIDAVLSSLDGMKRAEASPYLFSRIRYRMQQKTKPETLFIWKLALLMIFLLCLNSLALWRNKKDQSAEAATILASEYAITLPQDY